MKFRSEFHTRILACILALSCRQESKDHVIAEERRLFDSVISEASPNQHNYSAAEAKIGIDQNQIETRLLLSFPQIAELYREDVVLSSIANISIEIKTSRSIPVNPENIHLYLLTAPWSPFVSWNSRVSFLDGYEWQTPGGDLSSYGPYTPDISKTMNAEISYRTLTFNITPAMIELISMNELISGAIVLIKSNPTNQNHQLTVYTSNFSSHHAHPRAILVFNKEGILR